MAVDRDYIMNKMKGKMVSPAEFDFDKLQGPPLCALLSPNDIMNLNNVATSIRYSANIEMKLKRIDEILKPRGFTKFTGGTNRVVYKFMEDQSFIIKVATCAPAIGDNPREWINQNIYKPFVTKVFEVSPCGTVGLFERGIPITSREEFLSVASDIYDLLANWFTGQYVMDDIGSDYFMNWVIRANFGVILCDFPYSYKLDGNKLYCNAPVKSDSTQLCGGVIDYDDGYNHLKCTKCGVIYRAKQLEQAVKNNTVTVKGGNYNMEISITTNNGTKIIDNNPERYLDVTPKLIPRRKSKPTKKVEKKEVTFSITRSNSNTEEENKEELIEKVETQEEENISTIPYETYSATVSNTLELFGEEPRTKCLVLTAPDGRCASINDKCIIIDKIMDMNLSDLCIITKEANDELTKAIDIANNTISSLLATNGSNEILINSLQKKIDDLTDELDMLKKSDDDKSIYYIDSKGVKRYKSNNRKVYEQKKSIEVKEEPKFNTDSPLLSLEEVEESNRQLKEEIQDKNIVDLVDKAFPDEPDSAQEEEPEVVKTPVGAAPPTHVNKKPIVNNKISKNPKAKRRSKGSV